MMGGQSSSRFTAPKNNVTGPGPEDLSPVSVTKAELRNLPLLASVALAVRCARRGRPLLEGPAPDQRSGGAGHVHAEHAELPKRVRLRRRSSRSNSISRIRSENHGCAFVLK